MTDIIDGSFEDFENFKGTTVAPKPDKTQQAIDQAMASADRAMSIAKDLAAPQQKAFEVSEAGTLALRSVADQLAFAKHLIDQKMISESFKTPQQVVVAFQYAKAMKLNEVVACRLLYVVNGRPCLYGEGPLALCKRDGAVSSHEEFFFDKDYNRICFDNKNLHAPVYGACTRISRVGDPIPQEDHFTLDDLKRAGVDKGFGGKRKDVWEKWERQMMRYKARAMALRAKFPDLIAGIPISEYDEHFAPEVPEVEPQREATGADKLRAILAEGREVNVVPTEGVRDGSEVGREKDQSGSASQAVAGGAS